MHNTEYFCHYNRVEIRLPQINWEFNGGEKVRIDIELINPTSEAISFSDLCTHKTELIYTVYAEEGGKVSYVAKLLRPLPGLASGEVTTFPVDINIPDKAGKYQLMLSIGTKELPPGINGRAVTMIVHARSKKNST